MQASPDRLKVPCDPLGETLQQLRMKGMFYCHSELSEPWGMEMPVMKGVLMFHVVMEGSCLLRMEGTEERILRPGEFALVPHGEGHLLSSGHKVHCVDLFEIERKEYSERYEVLEWGGGGAKTSMICGAVRFEHPAAVQLVRLLPRLIHVTRWGEIEAEWIQSTLRLLELETRLLRPGSDAVITRLSDILLIQALRWWLSESSGAQKGWLGALRDERIGQVMIWMHRAPERDWTVESLASKVAMSRSGFSARFSELVGESPKRYLTRWRMQVALDLLREDEQLTLWEVADRFGYRSEAAFSRAFKRMLGVSPGKARRENKA